MADPKITILPPAKAYGYDRDTLTKYDQQEHDWNRLDDYNNAVCKKLHTFDHTIEPREYHDDPT